MPGSDARVTTPDGLRARLQRPCAPAVCATPSTLRTHLQRPRGLARVTGGAQPTSGGGATVRFLMTARLAVGGAWITWTVTGAPDVAGAQAPADVTTGSVSVARRWTG